MAASAEARSLKRAKTTSGIKGRKGAWYFSRAVRARAPIVRPWKLPVKATIWVFPGPKWVRAHLRLNLMAASTASVPELAK